MIFRPRVSIMSGEKIINTLVARPVNKKEIRSNPKAQESLDIEWDKLVKKTAWLYDTVQEWSTVSEGAKKKGKKVHVGKVFEICVEKGSELPVGHKLRKFKGRTVFQGNNVRDENADVALFSELGSSPATMDMEKPWMHTVHSPVMSHNKMMVCRLILKHSWKGLKHGWGFQLTGGPNIG